MSQKDEWRKTKAQWIKDNPPTHEGYWYCVVGFKALDKDSLTLDHDIPKGRNPSKRHSQVNLNPMCSWHNYLKGSRTLKEFLDSKPDLRCR